ncbi:MULTISPECIES: DNA polymerase III subunit psi [Vibrio]|uniref:DNA polymerase III subunit psi n=1 Tax=Vibrio bivalvicida TaxID=1276888 RepID=A0ABV4MF47_9VIBR|nr:DNA polymerase III subunit psi [Vibrio sp. VPAP30]KLN64205.1 DNA polymerase III subunit psi [Vibrio sp. VPAP30]
MAQLEQQYLHEMEIQCYKLAHPERLLGYQSPLLVLPENCKLLLVSPQLPQDKTAEMFERVLNSIKLPLEHALHIYPEQLSQLDSHHIEWVWFAGCQQDSEIEAKTLVSPLLTQVDGNNEQRRALWQQICSYQK